MKSGELRVYDDEEDHLLLGITLKGVDMDGKEWEEEVNVVALFDLWDMQVAFKLFSEFLPKTFPNIVWTFSSQFYEE